jgi:subtilisin family serine protease
MDGQGESLFRRALHRCAEEITRSRARPRALLGTSLTASVLALCAAPVAATVVPNDEFFARQWAASNTGQPVPIDESNEKFGEAKPGTPGTDERALRAWQISTGSRSVVIGEADTGVDYTQPDLAANIWSDPGGIAGCAAGTHGYSVLSKSCEPMDTEPLNYGQGRFGGHGTHVAGIMAAVGGNSKGIAGVDWQATVLPVKWLQAADEDKGVAKLIEALRWFAKAAREGVNLRVVNDSPTFEGTPSAQQIGEETEAIQELGAEGILFVTAAGNTAEDNDAETGRYPCRLGLPNEICVTATNDEDQLPSWANFGAHTVDLAAPGVSIYSTLREGKYGYLSGGSMAAAQVSGAAALILSVAPSLSPPALKQDILDNVDPLFSLSGVVASGGRLDVCKALPGCEPATVPYAASTEPAPPSPGAGTTGAAGGSTGQSSVLGASARAGGVVLGATTLAVQRGTVLVRLRCAGTRPCRGKLTISVKRVTRPPGKPAATKMLTIARAVYSLRAGQRKSFVLTLNANGRALLHAAPARLDALLRILPTGPAAGRSVTKHVRLSTRTSSTKKSGS